MRYYVTVEGRTLEVDLAGDTPRVDGQPVSADLSRVPGTPTRHFVVDGRSHVVVASRDGRERWDIHLDGERFEVDVVDERTRAIRAMTGQGGAVAGPRPVKAPMPGLVVLVHVAPGDRVEKGSSVAVIEAMKMENVLFAAADGVVGKVLAGKGESLAVDQPILEFE